MRRPRCTLPVTYLVLISVRGLVITKAIMQLDGLLLLFIIIYYN
jgi:hypothetical protein